MKKIIAFRIKYVNYYAYSVFYREIAGFHFFAFRKNARYSNLCERLNKGAKCGMNKRLHGWFKFGAILRHQVRSHGFRHFF
jgi:hypothetical protein